MGPSRARLATGLFILVTLLGYVSRSVAQNDTSASAGSSDNSRQILKPDASAMQFESRGLDYSALTKNNITVMFAELPTRIRDYNAIQVTITNASLLTWTVRPMDFAFVRDDGTRLEAMSADTVVESLLESASRSDVIHLQMMYEDSIYALANYRPTNGYEKRREAAMAQFVDPRLKAAAAASAVCLGITKLRSGESTDGAVFFRAPKKEKTLGPGLLVAHACGEQFVFPVLAAPKLHK